MNGTSQNFFHRCTIGKLAEEVLGVLTLSDDASDIEGLGGDEQEALRAWRYGAANLDRLERLHRDDPIVWSSFASTMGHQQACSWKLLTEWLAGAYHPKHLADAARSAIFSSKPGCNSQFLSRPQFPTSALLDQSVYHSRLGDLYCKEFLDYPDPDDPDYYLQYLFENLDFTRRRAAGQATSQNIAHTTFHSVTTSRKDGTHLPPPKQETSHYANPILQVCPWIPSSSTQPGIEATNPYYLWSIPENRTVEFSTLPDPKPGYTCISHTWGRWRGGKMVRVEGVPWLVPTNSIFDVQKMGEMFQVTRKRSNNDIPTDYVWFDLVCIPQTRDGELGRRAKLEVSRQAAIFTGSSYCLAWMNYIDSWEAENHTVNWLSFQYLYLSTAPGLYDVRKDDLDSLWTKSRDNPLQLTRHPRHRRYLGPSAFPVDTTPTTAQSSRKGGRRRVWRRLLAKSQTKNKLTINHATPNPPPEDFTEPSAWFSSLWTLQECCFCPHMTLMSRSFEPLCDASGTPLTLERLISLSNLTSFLMKPTSRVPDGSYPTSIDTNIHRGHQLHLVPNDRHIRDAFPTGATLLSNLFIDLHLHRNSSTSRTSIFIQGNARHCTKRRAEAILAVVDVRDWLNPEADGQDPSELAETDLVLGVYPLPFVREAARKFGPDFIMARKVDGVEGYLDGSVRGSMLPFAAIDPATRRGVGDIRMYHFQGTEVPWNEAFESWVFGVDGSVAMRRAAVLGESLGLLGRDGDGVAVYCPVVVNISWQEGEGDGGMRDEVMVSLREWLLKQGGEKLCTYAVNVSRQLGVVLRGVSPTRLVRVGCYEIVDHEEMPEVDDWVERQDVNWVPMRDVNWTVL